MMNGHGHDNPTFTSDDFTYKTAQQITNGVNIDISNGLSTIHDEKKVKGPETEERAVWSNKVEFLMSCIALSVKID